MRIERVTDPAEFAERVRGLLMADEARHNLMLGICTNLVRHPDVYPRFHLWLAAGAGGEVVGAAIMTPPFNVVVAAPTDDAAVPALVRAIAEEDVHVSGVTGAPPEVTMFRVAWCEATADSAKIVMASRIYRLTRVRVPRDVPGVMRLATGRDKELLVRWIDAFAAESMPEDAPQTPAHQVIDHRLRSEGAGLYLWEDAGRPVSLVGYGGFTPNGARIGPVYTPPEWRRRGYASALTAGVSRWLLREGRRFCFLYTDLTNPTSNRIYQEIGYEPVCDSMQYAFSPSSARA